MTTIARSPRDLGNLIQRARLARHWTQTDLARLAGLRQELVSRIETGHEGVRLASIYALLAALGLELMVGTRASGAAGIADVF